MEQNRKNPYFPHLPKVSSFFPAIPFPLYFLVTSKGSKYHSLVYCRVIQFSFLFLEVQNQLILPTPPLFDIYQISIRLLIGVVMS